MPDFTNMTFRLPRKMKEAFMAKLDAEDQTASQILRGAIRAYLADGGGNGAPSAAPASYTPPAAPIADTPPPPTEGEKRPIFFEDLRREMGFFDDDE